MSGRRENNERVISALRGARFGYKWIRVECPFCASDGHKDRKRSMGVAAASGVYSCFRCGRKGRLEDPPDPSFAQDDRPRAVDANGALSAGQEAWEPPEGYLPLGEEPGASALALEPARRYLLEDRKLPPKKWQRYQLGACADGYWGGRVIIPLLSADDDPVWLGWIARLWIKRPSSTATGRNALPYLYPKGMPKGEMFWNHRALRIETDEPVMIVEGAFDALPYGKHAAAALGTMSHVQLEALIEARRPVAFVPDGDAWREGWAYAMRLRFEGQRAGFVRLPPKVDPDEVDHAWLREEARKSLDAPL